MGMTTPIVDAKPVDVAKGGTPYYWEREDEDD